MSLLCIFVSFKSDIPGVVVYELAGDDFRTVFTLEQVLKDKRGTLNVYLNFMLWTSGKNHVGYQLKNFFKKVFRRFTLTNSIIFTIDLASAKKN